MREDEEEGEVMRFYLKEEIFLGQFDGYLMMTWMKEVRKRETLEMKSQMKSQNMKMTDKTTFFEKFWILESQKYL